MPVCIRCDTNVGLFSFRSYLKQTKRCNKCDAEIELAVIRFINLFREFAADGVLTRDEWRRLNEVAEQDNLDINEALRYAHPDVIELIRRGVEIATKDNVITAHEENYLNFLLGILDVPESLVQEVRSTVSEYKTAHRARCGDLPVVRPTMSIPYGEMCHMEVPSVYINTDTKTYPERVGTFLATDRRLIFSSPRRQFEIDWMRVRTVVRKGDTIYLEMSVKKGNGLYTFERPVFAEAVINRLVEVSRTQQRHGEQKERDQRRSSQRPTEATSGDAKTPYQILNLQPGASKDEIRTAYREMAKLYHPDKVAALAPEFRQLAEVRMKEINVAYQELAG